MKKSRGKPPVSPAASLLTNLRGNTGSARLPSDYSPTNQKVEGVNDKFNFSDLVDYQLTVRPKVELTRYQISMLLEVKCYEFHELGFRFIDWITLEWLFSKLLGSRKVWEIRDKYERRVLTLANIILLTTQNSWLQMEDRAELPNLIREYISTSGLMISERTFWSRIDYWRPEKFLEVRAVRLDVFLEREDRTIRYSSYTKGYGESSRMGRRQKTRPSTELDGEDEEQPEVVIPLVEIPNLLILTMLELRRKYQGKR